MNVRWMELLSLTPSQPWTTQLRIFMYYCTLCDRIFRLYLLCALCSVFFLPYIVNTVLSALHRNVSWHYEQFFIIMRPEKKEIDLRRFFLMNFPSIYNRNLRGRMKTRLDLLLCIEMNHVHTKI